MKDLIDYISQIFGLEMKSTIAILDMESDIGEIQNHADYVRYLKNGFNLDDIKFLTAYQKFLTLTKRYKVIEVETINRSALSKKTTSAERLASKVREIDTIVLNNQNSNHKWEQFKIDNEQKENWFSEKEIATLSSIGSPLTCVRLQRQVSGRDMLSERLEALYVEKVMHQQLEAPKTMSLIENLTNSKKI